MKTIIFIIGAGHSGSTVLAKALNSHSKIFALSEIAQLNDELKNVETHCGCGTKLRNCPFWEDINRLVRAKSGYGIKDMPNKFRISREDGKNRVVDKIHFKFARIVSMIFSVHPKIIEDRLSNIKLLFDTVIEKTGNEYLVDSSKSAKWSFLLQRYLKKNGYRIKVIHLVRDGRGVLYSYLKGYYKVKLKSPKTGVYEVKTFYSYKKKTKEEIVKLWKRDTLSSFLHKIVNKNCYYFLQYEDFTTYPVDALKKILAFLELSYEEEMLDLNRFENHMVSGNASRINAERILKPFENWKKNLSKNDLVYFKKKGGWLNKKLGYKNDS